MKLPIRIVFQGDSLVAFDYESELFLLQNLKRNPFLEEQLQLSESLISKIDSLNKSLIFDLHIVTQDFQEVSGELETQIGVIDSKDEELEQSRAKITKIKTQRNNSIWINVFQVMFSALVIISSK